MELSEESAVNQEKKKERESERRAGKEKKKILLADFFPLFFLGFLSPSLRFFLLCFVHGKLGE